MLIVIIGCGRMGGMLANALSRQGFSVIIIDVDERAFRTLTTDFGGFQMVGDATEIEVLKQAKVQQADILLVLTGDDNINLTVAQIGKRFFKVPNTIARVFDYGRESIFNALGIKTICPTILARDKLLEQIEGMSGEKS